MKEQNKKQAIKEMAKVIKSSLDGLGSGHHHFTGNEISTMFAQSLYEEGYRKQEWISVENPPETYRDEYDELIPFLVCCKGTVYPFRAVYDGTNWGDGIGKLNVTHWMPLPEPPKMRKEDEGK